MSASTTDQPIVARQNQGRKFKEKHEFSNTLNWELRFFNDGEMCSRLASVLLSHFPFYFFFFKKKRW
jgi:hypothetical protein